ncbi:hypothetical protein DFP72DRAFT_840509 [Ephemerocybe angulata]|uniref:Uncharacterized protein n=1 Tax=Ephemerocybe angulata TaxID=980116 RepID=A0A8H6MGZ4_9AGAR|nr:hypothetical protein DFP72DRAFT_840509 [Tulosesus angulatus]
MLATMVSTRHDVGAHQLAAGCVWRRCLHLRICAQAYSAAPLMMEWAGKSFIMHAKLGNPKCPCCKRRILEGSRPRRVMQWTTRRLRMRQIIVRHCRDRVATFFACSWMGPDAISDSTRNASAMHPRLRITSSELPHSTGTQQSRRAWRSNNDCRAYDISKDKIGISTREEGRNRVKIRWRKPVESAGVSYAIAILSQSEGPRWYWNYFANPIRLTKRTEETTEDFCPLYPEGPT